MKELNYVRLNKPTCEFSIIMCMAAYKNYNPKNNYAVKLTFTLTGDLLAIEQPSSITSSTVVSHTCGSFNGRTSGILTWVYEAVHWI